MDKNYISRDKIGQDVIRSLEVCVFKNFDEINIKIQLIFKRMKIFKK